MMIMITMMMIIMIMITIILRYLIAIVVGELESAELSPRCRQLTNFD